MFRCASQTARAMGLREAEIDSVLAEARTLWDGCDYDSDGLLSRDEWTSAAFVLASIFRDCLVSIFDLDDTGSISQSEWQLFVRAVANGLAEVGSRPPASLLSHLEASFDHHQVSIFLVFLHLSVLFSSTPTAARPTR